MPHKPLLLTSALLLCGCNGVNANDAAAPDPQALVLACSGCHSVDATALPHLTGMDPERFLAAMRGFQAGSRPASIMDRIARGYSDAELAAMAAFFREP